MLIWVVVLVSLIIFVLTIVKGFRHWGALHTVLLSILFIEAWCFVFFSAGVASRRVGFIRAHDILKVKVDKLEEEVVLAMYGNRLDPTLDLERYVPLTNELNRLLLERGRVWRGSSVVNATATGAKVKLKIPAPAAAAPAPAPANAGAGGAQPAAAAANNAPKDGGLEEKSIVYAFGETGSADRPLPTTYLGEYSVSESKDGDVTLVPTAVLTKEQADAIASGGFISWAIYELVPLDSHNAFAVLDSAIDENQAFGRMDRDELAKLLGIDLQLADAIPSTLNIKDGIKASVLQSYINDGGRAPDGTPPEHLGYRVEFLKDHVVDVDAEETRNAMEGGYFDLSGRSVDQRLKRGTDGVNVTFKAGEIHLFDASTAETLSGQGIVKLGAPIYVRSLNDYEFAFREFRKQTTRAQQDSLLIRREIEETNRTLKVTEDQIRFRQDERSKLDKDVAQYNKEHEVITSEKNRLDSEITQKLEELSSLYTTLHDLHGRLKARQLALNDAINAATLP